MKVNGPLGGAGFCGSGAMGDELVPLYAVGFTFPAPFSREFWFLISNSWSLAKDQLRQAYVVSPGAVRFI